MIIIEAFIPQADDFTLGRTEPNRTEPGDFVSYHVPERKISQRRNQGAQDSQPIVVIARWY